MDPARALPIRATALAALLAACLVTAACAAPTSYMGIALAPGAAHPAVQTLARSALTGDKHAQLALGIRYEQGDGVAADPERARKLYRAAATQTGGTIYVYVPSSWKGGDGTVYVGSRAQAQGALVQAACRLVRLENRVPLVLESTSNDGGC